MRDALRRDDLGGLARILATEPGWESRDDQGNTPLMHAAQVGSHRAFQLLLDRGASPSATNHAGASVLLRAATDPAKVRLLLQRGADPRVASALGHTPLMLAARSIEATESVRLLLEHGADIHARSRYGADALMAAAAAGNLEVVRLLVERGADLESDPMPQDPGLDPIWGGLRTPLMWAAFRGHREMVRYLLDHGAPARQVSGFGTALSQTAWRGHRDVARLLLERGADPHQAEPFSGFTPLHWAAAADHEDPEFVRFLLSNGMDPLAAGGQPVDAFLGVPQTPVSLARQRGANDLVRILQQAAMPSTHLPSQSIEPDQESLLAPDRSPEAQGPRNIHKGSTVRPEQIWTAIQAAMGPLQRSAELSHASFVRHASRQDCTSCHQQYQPMAAVGMARDLGVPTDRSASERLTELVLRVHRGTELDAQALFHPEATHDYGYLLMGLHREGTQAPEVTDPLVAHLAAIQEPDGHWSLNLYRPPMQSSDITATALAIQALSRFGWPARKAEFDDRIRRGRRWLEAARPQTTEEWAYHLLGLAWAGVSSEDLRVRVQPLLDLQRPEGGWAQLPGMATDAYATGQVMVALQDAAGFEATHPVLQRAARFLIDTQYPDGTWHVRRRAFPFQPTMDSGFSHGRDGWISASGTSWAVMALAKSMDPVQAAERSLAAPNSHQTRKPEPIPAVGTGVELALPAGTERVEFNRDLQPVLDRSCVPCHSGDRPRSRYRLTSREELLTPGNVGLAPVVPGASARSPLIQYMVHDDDDLAMPPRQSRDQYPRLTTSDIAKFRDWIDQGANQP